MTQSGSSYITNPSGLKLDRFMMYELMSPKKGDKFWAYPSTYLIPCLRQPTNPSPPPHQGPAQVVPMPKKSL